jgi:hypothetical protein
MKALDPRITYLIRRHFHREQILSQPGKTKDQLRCHSINISWVSNLKCLNSNTYCGWKHGLTPEVVHSFQNTLRMIAP